MLSSKFKDVKIRRFFAQQEKKKLINKFLFINFSNLFTKSHNRYLLLNFFAMRLSKTQIKNRCVVTGRGRGVNSYYSLSRMVFRDFAQFGILPGYKKSVW